MGNVVSIDSARNGKKSFPEMVDEIASRMDEMGINDHEFEAAKDSVVEERYPEGFYAFVLEEFEKDMSIFNTTPLKNPRQSSLIRMGRKFNDLLRKADEEFKTKYISEIHQELSKQDNPNY